MDFAYTYTIIIPHKNIPLLLQRCLDSIPLRQDIQVVIVDDNSSPAVVDFDNFPGSERKDTEIIHTSESKGAGYARNCGLAAAKGRWLLFADADDFFLPGFLDVLDTFALTDYDIRDRLAKSISDDEDIEDAVSAYKQELITNGLDDERSGGSKVASEKQIDEAADRLLESITVK